MKPLNLEYFIPKIIPREVKRYRSNPRQLAVGSSGKLGGLRLGLARSDSGKTIIKDMWKQVPLQVLRPFYFDENEPDLAIIYVLNPTGGILQGDRSRMDISLGAGCKVHVTTQAATKIYGMNSDYATQSVNLLLGPESYLEYLPDQTIPYRNSRFYQEVNVRVSPSSTFLHWEILTPGRREREHFEFDIFYSRLSVLDQTGRVILSDTTVLDPTLADFTRIGIMGKFDVLGNFYSVSPKVTHALVDRIHSSFSGSRVLHGVSPTSLAPGLVARVLGHSTLEVRAVLQEIWNQVRLEVLGSPAPNIRK